MLGNVAEWVFDWYIEYFVMDIQRDGCPHADPLGPKSERIFERYIAPGQRTINGDGGEHGRLVKEPLGRVTRGGAYDDDIRDIRERRGNLLSRISSPSVGFRLARSIAESTNP